MKVGIFSPYFQTLGGGGERYVLSVAEFFLNRGDQVDIFGLSPSQKQKAQERFAIDLSLARSRPDIFFSSNNFFEKFRTTVSYDFFFFLSDGSIPSTFARQNMLHFQVPFNFANQNTWQNKLKLRLFSKVVCNSLFTKKFIDRTYGINSDVLYPPIDTAKFKTTAKKEKLILSVGLFYRSRPKGQDLLVKTFLSLVKKLPGWRFVVIGAATKDSLPELTKLKKLAKDYPVEFISQVSFKRLQEYYQKASIYWHAAGFSVDLEREPEKAEHFGMTTVEAMASGAVPVVFAGGGQKEIINDGENGLLWQTPAELVSQTLKIVGDNARLQSLSQAAVKRSRLFSKEKFFQNLTKLI